MHQEFYKNKPFKFMHCWQLLQDCQKWATLRTSIGKGVLDETQMPRSGPTPRPIGNKKVKKMQETRELKIMATDTSNMLPDRQEYFVQEVARIMNARKQMAEDADTQEG